jgi:hypothetical protein
MRNRSKVDRPAVLHLLGGDPLLDEVLAYTVNWAVPLPASSATSSLQAAVREARMASVARDRVMRTPELG